MGVCVCVLHIGVLGSWRLGHLQVWVRRQQAETRQLGLDFVQSELGFAKLTVLGTMVAAQQDLMRKHLAMSGSAWEDKEAAKVAFAADVGAQYERRFRAEVAFRGDFEREFLHRLEGVLSSDLLQRCVPTSSQVVFGTCRAAR